MTGDRAHPYTQEEIRELRRLNALSSKTRGSDPADSPRRQAGDAFVKKVVEVQQSYDPPLTWAESSHDLGINHRTLRAKVARRLGGDLLPPSQKQYTGKPYNENRRTRTTFSCGHPRVKDNTYWNRTLKIDVCVTCQKAANERSRQKREARKKAQALGTPRPTPATETIGDLIDQEA